MKALSLGAALAVGILMSADGAEAQAKPGAAGGRKPKVIQLEEITIEGRVQKPNAFYILNRSNLGYEVLDLRTSFLRDVVKSVQKEPF
ncbi:MAG TPA: hypothetical protein VFX59_21915 [Polyangiales bacterium]|nr:hypothetical protein [Polyangiales bacterium]